MSKLLLHKTEIRVNIYALNMNINFDPNATTDTHAQHQFSTNVLCKMSFFLTEIIDSCR